LDEQVPLTERIDQHALDNSGLVLVNETRDLDGNGGHEDA
jgi:hypothetical protein